MALACALACALVLGGCGGVEFEGKVFDYMGISGDRQQPDVKMSERPPLMVPPSLNTLPQPGTSAAVAANRQDWPDDPEHVRKRVAKADKEAKAKREAEIDPLNPYHGKETLLDKLFQGSDTEEEPIADVPEPDPSDRIPEDKAVAQSKPQPLQPHVPQAPLPDRNDEDFNPEAPDSYKTGGTNIY